MDTLAMGKTGRILMGGGAVEILRLLGLVGG
jgi:hypothetical protein